jgi:hypothetical protein
MNRNVIIGIVAIAVIVLAVLLLMPGAEQPAGDVTAPASQPGLAPNAPAPTN